MSANGNKSFGPAPAVDNPPCPTAPSLTLERYNEIRVLAERVPRLLPPGSYYTLTENPHPTGENDKYKIAFMAREPGCPEDCQHCREEAAAIGIPPLSADSNNNSQAN